MSTTPHSRPAPASGAGDRPGLIRLGLHLLLAALPLLAISAHVFGLVRMQLSAAVLVIPLATAMVALAVFAPHGGDRVLAHGMVWGIVACAVYDVFRLDTVYLLGWWADFIPTMGTWITGEPDDLVGGAVVGYLWRYVGDGGGIGITFFALASAVGLHRHSRRTVVLTCIAFAVFPVWTGLIGTVALAAGGQTMMFPLTPTTVTLSLVGHLIFGWILGLGFWRSRAVQRHWPWEPFTGEQPALLPPDRHAVLAEGSGPGTAPPRPASGPVAIPHPAGPASISGPLPAVRTSRSTGPVTASATGRAGPEPVPGHRDLAHHDLAHHDLAHHDLAHRDLGTPHGGQTLGPETWELWQRQLQTTVRGRRTHSAPRTVRSRAR